MGVAKTKMIPLFSIPGNSWFIYTPTKKINILKLKYPTKIFKNPSKIPIFSPSTHQNTNIATNIVKPQENQHILTPHNPNPKPQSKQLSSYINTKIPTKSTLSPINNFLIKITSITSKFILISNSKK